MEDEAQSVQESETVGPSEAVVPGMAPRRRLLICLKRAVVVDRTKVNEMYSSTTVCDSSKEC